MDSVSFSEKVLVAVEAPAGDQAITPTPKVVIDI